MNVDRYTKAVLTVIAAALSAIVLQNAIQPTLAQDAFTPRPVVICDRSGITCAGVSTDIVSGNLLQYRLNVSAK